MRKSLIVALLLCGCLFPAQRLRAAETIEELPLTAVDREHWAYRPLSVVEIPQVRDRGWLQTPVDAFVLAKLEDLGLTGGYEATRETLLRRLMFDLTGLPPSPAELAAFRDDPAPDAYERLVEQLLAAPAYGERWAQHWLDLARFAETDGFEHDKVREDAWRYRDWVIDALNADLPYDQFLRQQLAGDEIPQGDAIATMFCLAGPDMPDVNDQLERRHFRLNELTATVGAVVLGMQVGCAECHDHKYDPISQADFYRLRAVFEPAVPVLKRDAPYNALSNQSDVAPARLWIRGDHRRPGPVIEPGLPRIALSSTATLPAEPRSGLRTALAETLVSDAGGLTARVIVNRLWHYHFGRGLCDTPSDFGLINSEPTHPELLDWLARDLQTHDWSWKHIHRRIVMSATYRQQSRRSTSDKDWNQRLAKDPGNRWLSRSPRRRLDGESLRDALLAVSGELNRERQGPGVRPPLPEELVRTLLKGQWITSPKSRDHTRRSIYLFARRNLRYPLLESFDRPDANASCAVRGRSTTAPQALGLLNSDLSNRAAQLLAGRVLDGETATPVRLRQLFQWTLARDPVDSEVRQFTDFLTAHSAALESLTPESSALPQPLPVNPLHNPQAGAAWVDACLALLNSNEFLYCD